jgi:hypothetical protein
MSFAVIAISIGVAGAGISAYSSIAGASAQKASANYNAQVQRNNAAAANQQAKFDAAQITRANERNQGMQRAAMSASGFDANTGTFSDVQSDTKKQGELDRLSRMYQGAIGMVSSTSGAQLYKSQSESATDQGLFGAGSSILGAAEEAVTIEANPIFQN